MSKVRKSIVGYVLLLVLAGQGWSLMPFDGQLPHCDADSAHFTHPGRVTKISISGPMTSDSPVHIQIPDQPPAFPGAPAPFALMVKINDWTAVIDTVVWNEETQSWEASWQIPPAMTGATVVVTALFTNGQTATKSFTVH